MLRGFRGNYVTSRVAGWLSKRGSHPWVTVTAPRADVLREINDTAAEWRIFLPNVTAFGMKPGGRSSLPWIMHIRSALTYESRRREGGRRRERKEIRGTSGDESVRRSILSNDTLHLFVHHTREFTSSKRSSGYSTDNNVTLDTVQCAYTIHIYKSTFARSADPRLCVLLSLSLSFSRTLFRSLPLSHSLLSLSLS